MASKADYPNINMEDSQQFRQVVQNVHTMFNRTSPEDVAKGMQWYDVANEAVAKGIRGKNMDPLSGAGLVAAVSPGMDWDTHNIGAFRELHSLRQQHWDALAAGDRSPVLGMSINRASTSDLLKAGRIMAGEHVDTVLSPQTAPKTNSFAHNINLEEGPVTIDGRAHDIGANRMQGWQMDRGISSAALKTGKTTRYEHFADAYRGATQSLNEEHGTSMAPFQTQAVTWQGGKSHELSFPTKKGTPRVKGVTRTGQSYV